MCSNCENDPFDCISCISVNFAANCKSSTEVRLNRSKSNLRSQNQSSRFTDKNDCSHSMFKNCHCPADTFSQNENNIYGYTDSKGHKKSMSKYATYLTKLDEFKHNICNIKDEFKPYILGMCETFFNEEKCKKNSRELVD